MYLFNFSLVLQSIRRPFGGRRLVARHAFPEAAQSRRQLRHPADANLVTGEGKHLTWSIEDYVAYVLLQ